MSLTQSSTFHVTGITHLFTMCRSYAAHRCVKVTLAVFLIAGVAHAQPNSASGTQRATRAALTARLSQLEIEAQGTKLSPEAKNKALVELATIRSRLEQGDFRVGDRFIITIRRDSVRSDTASVRDSLNVTIANLPDVSLAGVLRSELDDKLSKHVATYLLNTSVRTTMLTRVAILGAVQRPGFYYALPDRPVSDLVMLAGGPAPDANLNELEISRSRTQLINAKDSRRAIKEGRTLEQLDIRSGDEVTISAKRKVNWQLVIQTLLIVSSLLFGVIQFLQFYYRQKAGN